MMSTSKCFSVMGWIPPSWNLLRLVILMGLILPLLLMSGCSHQTTVNEASTYLQAQALQVEIDSYRMQLERTRADLTAVLPQFQQADPNPPISLTAPLIAFLEDNDCLKASDKEYCYKVTVTQLILTTQKLDQQNLDNWAAKQTIAQLVSNINFIVSGLEKKSDSLIPEGVKAAIHKATVPSTPPPILGPLQDKQPQ